MIIQMLLENADLYKLVFNIIMTTHRQCVNYNFVAPLRWVVA